MLPAEILRRLPCSRSSVQISVRLVPWGNKDWISNIKEIIFIHDILDNYWLIQELSWSCVAAAAGLFMWKEAWKLWQHLEPKHGSCIQGIVVSIKTGGVHSYSKTIWNSTLALWTICFHSIFNDKKHSCPPPNFSTELMLNCKNIQLLNLWQVTLKASVAGVFPQPPCSFLL